LSIRRWTGGKKAAGDSLPTVGRVLHSPRVEAISCYDSITMSDDLKTFSVQVPAELLKESPTPTGHVKAEDGAEKGPSITLRVTPEQFKLFTELRQDFESFFQSQVADSRAAVDMLVRTSTIHLSFYEKLILLAGGSFALSLTFLLSLQRHALQGVPLVAMSRLKGAWGLLLLCIVSSWLHNLIRCRVVDNAMAANATFVTAMQHKSLSSLFARAAGLFKTMESSTTILGDFMALGSTTAQGISKQKIDGGAEYVKRVKRFWMVSGILGGLGLLSIILAFWLMVQFAMRNAALL